MSSRLECAVAFALWLGTGSSPMAQLAPPKWTDVVRESGPAQADLLLLRATAEELTRVSTTFAKMLGIVKSASRLILFVRTVNGTERLGQTHFYVVSGKTYGVMEINPYRLQPLLRRRAIAHELAHAVEIACMPWQLDTLGLRSILIARARSNSWHGARSTETRFPSALERTVLNESQLASSLGNEMSTPAETHGLADCGLGVPIEPR